MTTGQVDGVQAGHQRRRLPGGRSFHLLLLSLAASSFGDWVYNIALLALVYVRTGSPTWVAATTAARVLPMVVIGPLGGVLADRHDRRGLMIASDIARFALMLALAAVAATGLPIVLAPLLAAAATAAGTVHPPCVAGCTARVVPDGELQRANALRTAVGQAAVVAGPALGALLLAVSTPAVAILLNGLSFVASAAAIVAIPAGPVFRPGHRDASSRPSVAGEVRAGVLALRGAPVAVRLIAADVLCSMVYGLSTVTLVLVSRQVGAGGGGYGILLAAFGAGGVLGSLVAGRLDGGMHWRRTLAGALVLVAFPLAALGLVHTLVLALAFSVLAGAGMVVGEVLSETALPRMLDDEVLARAYGLVLPVSVAGIVVGSLIASPLVALFGLTGALMFAGVLVLVLAGALLYRPVNVAVRVPAAVPSSSV